MKQLLFIAIIFTFISGSYIYIPSIANAETISKEETTTVATRKFAVDKKENVKASDESADITNNEKKLLARLVHAEAKGEPFAGKVAVADVVLNRLDDKQFPDTVESVIYEKNAFQPVQNGSIDKAADKESMEAVEEALNNGKENKELLYFYNPDTATSDWIFTRQVIKHIGNHAFSI
ncbi:cell wall hydrolase [Niallia circulans]|uniref:cell wall hydrolase n=1 Tax=Niallia circulans TaxID=1397 RepID=UPI00201DD697|nr:cell wall hydrolase [Niallia circulans]UQZ73870.1 cell wall hydrolase [Niallia circulans]